MQAVHRIEQGIFVALTLPNSCPCSSPWAGSEVLMALYYELKRHNLTGGVLVHERK
jgi:hypothetical protein